MYMYSVTPLKRSESRLPYAITASEKVSQVSAVKPVAGSAEKAAQSPGTNHTASFSRLVSGAAGVAFYGNTARAGGKREPEHKVSAPMYVENMGSMLSLRGKNSQGRVDPEYIRRAMERLGNYKLKGLETR